MRDYFVNSSWRAMTFLRILLVPSPMERILASR